MDLLNSENLDTNVSGMFSNMYGRKRYSNKDAKFQPFVMYRNADGEVVLSSEPVLTTAPIDTTATLTTAPIDTTTTVTSPTRSSTTTLIAEPSTVTAPIETTTTPLVTTAPIETAPIETTTTPLVTTAPAPIETAPTRSSTETFTLNPIIEPAPTGTPRTSTATLIAEPLTLTPTGSEPRPIAPIIINTAPTSVPVLTSSIPRPMDMPIMPMGGGVFGGGGGGGVAPSEEGVTEVAKTATDVMAKKGMSKGAKLAIVGLLAVGGYFAWKYRDMIFKK